MQIKIPELSLVLLIGASGSGKSTFARQHFKPTEVLSSDFCRALVSDDENDQDATAAAFDVLFYIARKRLAAGKLTVIDATNVRPEDRKRYVQLAREFHCLPVAIVLNLPEQVSIERNRVRSDRNFGAAVIRNQLAQLRRGLRHLKAEGFRHIFVLESPEQVEAAQVQREPLYNNLKQETGPFDIIGDIHGCYDELLELLAALGYRVEQRDGEAEGSVNLQAPHDAGGRERRLIFLGDLVDRGPRTPAVLRLVMQLCASGQALCVPGNHDVKLKRKLRGEDVRVNHGLEQSLDQLSQESVEFNTAVRDFIDALVSHYVLDGGRLVVAHAGLKEEMHGRGSGAVREFCLYGETTGETDEFGLPVRYPWARDYRGKAAVVYGHTPVPQPEWLNNTINIDTGCVFGGSLSALRYPERELLSIPAHEQYAVPARPIGYLEADGKLSAQQQHDDMLRLEDVAGKRQIETRLMGRVGISAEEAEAAIEVLSRFALDPRWLIYLPPTMAPPETSRLPELLEHPAEVFAYFRKQGVEQLICQEKHMGSRAVLVLCRDLDAARERFGIAEAEQGVCYTRSGRRFFEDSELESHFIRRLAEAATACGLWERLSTSWVCLDCELMPWSQKAQALLQQQYAVVGSAGRAALAASQAALLTTLARQDAPPELAELAERHTARAKQLEHYIAAYRNYCWPVSSVDDLRLAPFHLLASEGAVHSDKDHRWHLDQISLLCGADPGLLQLTRSRELSLADPASVEAAINWWTELTAAGGEGMVVKPLSFIASHGRGLVQPALKCRGREYLRIIYGPEYTLPQHIERLRERSVSRKRSLAQREFALGIEGLERFVRREPLRRVHECALGVLALECEPLDPRL